MRITLYRVYLLLTGMVLVPPVAGQIDMKRSDSIPIIKPDLRENLFQFFDNNEAITIQISPLRSEFVYYKANPVMRDMGDFVMTMITGIGFNSTRNANWKISGSIGCNGLLPDWNVNLYCEGYVEKNRERVQNDDGSWSVETYETNVYYWDKEATGVLIEGFDTIGFFLIIMNPRENELLKSYAAEIWPPQKPQKKTKSNVRMDVFWKPSPGVDFGIIGKLHNKNFVMIQNGKDRKAWIFSGNSYLCMFQNDINFIGIRKKYIVLPYLLINKEIPQKDRLDLFMLAMVSKILNWSINMPE
jgi:hypothetical protein